MDRRERAYALREAAAKREMARHPAVHMANGDEQRYLTRIANFSKCLPCNDLGEVDRRAYDSLLVALESNRIEDYEMVPFGGTLRISSPMGGVAFDLVGPDSAAISVPPAYRFDSEEFAADVVELYWMALLRDVPFTDYETNALVAEAVADLNRFSSHPFSRDPGTGLVSGRTLFSLGYPGTLQGPRVSQFLLRSYSIDGAAVTQRISVPLPIAGGAGHDFLTHYEERLSVQRGAPEGFVLGDPVLDPIPRYIGNGRDLGWGSDQSGVVSTYLKAAFQLVELGRMAQDGNNPYRSRAHQGGLGTFDFLHLLSLLGHVASGRHCNYSKWHVHRLLRPEELGCRVHNHLRKMACYPIHESLLSSPALVGIFEHNKLCNNRRGLGDVGTYLLPCTFSEGAPTHPSYPAGHAIAAAIGVTILKAWFDEDMILPDGFTVKLNDDKTALEPYVAGVDGPPLTVGGELNKLVDNITMGRSFAGVHYRMDGAEGNTFGEEIAIRILTEGNPLFAEPFDGFSLTKFDGSRVMTA